MGVHNGIAHVLLARDPRERRNADRVEPNASRSAMR